MKKWEQKLDLALEAYIQRQTDLRGGAKMAGVSYNRFAQEIEERRIIVLDDDGGFLERLQFLADAFDDQILQEAIKKVAEESNSEQLSDQTASSWMAFPLISGKIIQHIKLKGLIGVIRGRYSPSS